MDSYTTEGAIAWFGKRAITLEIARTQAELSRGLSDRPEIEVDHGMLFIMPWNNMLTPFTVERMRFPIDIIFLDQNWRVVWIFENAQPGDKRPFISNFPYRYVIEAPAGTYRSSPVDKVSVVGV